MALNVGVNVVEVDGRASPAIQAAPTSVAAFIGRTERGVPDRPVRISTPAQFRERFGRHLAGGYLAYAVEGFFLNGGREAYVSRVVGAASAPAVTTLNNRLSPATGALRVRAGYRGQDEPGAWGNRLRLDVRDDPRASTRLVSFTPGGSTAQLESLNGFRVGSVVRFVNGGTTTFRKLISVDPATGSIGWDPASPIAALGPASQVTSAEYRVVVRYQPAATEPPVAVEEWPNLSMESDSPDYAVDRINHAFTGSRYIAVTDVSAAAATGQENPAVTSNQALGGGTDATPTAPQYAGDAAQRTGLFAFDTAQVQLLAVPDAHTLDAAGRRTAVRAALDYCAGRGDCTFVGAAPDRGLRSGVTTARVPGDYSQLESDYVGTVKTYSALFQGSKVYGALYVPFIQVTDPVGTGPAPTLFVPPDGHVMGVYARTEQERGIWKAPAGNAAQVRGALAVSAGFDRRPAHGPRPQRVRQRDPADARLRHHGGRLAHAQHGYAVVVRERAAPLQFRQELAPGWPALRPAGAALRGAAPIGPVQRGHDRSCWACGARAPSAPIRPNQVFTVKCDAENNPPAEVDLGNFRIEVYFYPVRPAETILIVVGQQPSGASAAEA